MTAARAPRLYLDNAATAPLRPAARAAMLDALAKTGNPSSVHAEGRAARAIVEAAREKVAALAGARPKQVVFTSGATEANVWVLRGPWDTRVISAVEHASVLEPARAAGARIVRVGSDGTVDLAALEDSLKGAAGRTLVSIQTANNETGVVQPMAEIVAAAKAAGALVHTDAVQAAGKIELRFSASGVDVMSLSAHKIGGPQGVGALILRDDASLAPMLTGGGQEMRRRAGTENVAAIAGFGAAAEAALADLQQADEIAARRDSFETALKARFADARIFGEGAVRLPTISNLAMPGARAESLVIALDLAGAAVSAGSACSSGKVSLSHVLAAMGAQDDLAASALRISLGWSSAPGDLDRFLDIFSAVAPRHLGAAARAPALASMEA